MYIFAVLKVQQTDRAGSRIKIKVMSYAIYKETKDGITIVDSKTRKSEIEKSFNQLKRSFKNYNVDVVREGYFTVPELSVEYWIVKIQKTTNDKYIGKWYTYNVCGSAKVIVKVTGTENATDSYIGRKTTIFKDGHSLNEDWKCFYKSFHARIKDKEIREFKF